MPTLTASAPASISASDEPQTEAAYRAMVANTPALSHLLADEPKLAALIATLKAKGTLV